MSAAAENLKILINQYCRNDGINFFHNLRGNNILLQIVALADAAGGGGGTGSFVIEVTSANFSNSTDCPLTTLAGKNIAVFYNEIGRFLEKDSGEWTDLAGGGFRVLIAGFDSTQATFHFVVFVK